MPSLPRRELRQVSGWFCPSTPGQHSLSVETTSACLCHTTMDVVSCIAVGRDQRHFFFHIGKGKQWVEGWSYVSKVFPGPHTAQMLMSTLEGRVLTGGPGHNEWNRELSWETGGRLHLPSSRPLPSIPLSTGSETFDGFMLHEAHSP